MDNDEQAPAQAAAAATGVTGSDQAFGYNAPQLIYQNPLQAIGQVPAPVHGQNIQIPIGQPQVLPIAGPNGPQINANIGQPQQQQQFVLAGQPVPGVQVVYPLPTMQLPGVQLQYMHPQGVPQLNSFGEVIPRNHFPLGALNRSPGRVLCPICNHSGMTMMTFVTGNSTHMWAALACFCLCLGCIPYLVTDFKDIVHCCASCGAQLATWHRDGGTQVHAVV